MDIFITLKVLITITSIFPDHTNELLPFSSWVCIENRRFLLLKKSPGDNSIKTLKSDCLLSTLYI